MNQRVLRLSRPLTWPGWLALVIDGAWHSVEYLHGADFLAHMSQNAFVLGLVRALARPEGNLLLLAVGVLWIVLTSIAPLNQRSEVSGRELDHKEPPRADPPKITQVDETLVVSENADDTEHGIVVLGDLERHGYVDRFGHVDQSPTGEINLALLGLRNEPLGADAWMAVSNVRASLSFRDGGSHVYVDTAYWLRARSGRCKIDPGETEYVLVALRKTDGTTWVVEGHADSSGAPKWQKLADTGEARLFEIEIVLVFTRDSAPVRQRASAELFVLPELIRARFLSWDR